MRDAAERTGIAWSVRNPDGANAVLPTPASEAGKRALNGLRECPPPGYWIRSTTKRFGRLTLVAGTAAVDRATGPTWLEYLLADPPAFVAVTYTCRRAPISAAVSVYADAA